MGKLTEECAKPALSLGFESIISRLVRQISNDEHVEHIFVNCSYQAKSIVDALENINLMERLTFLWEREYMGTAWSLKKISEISKRDILTIHGDLLIGSLPLTKFIKSICEIQTDSVMAFHRRKALEARSIIKFEPESSKILTFEDVSWDVAVDTTHHISQYLFSNSGLYFFRTEHLNSFDLNELRGKNITQDIVAKLIAERKLSAIEFAGPRLSIENSDDLIFARNNVAQFN